MWKLLGGIFGGLIVGWILTWFGIDNIIYKGIYYLSGVRITREIYYLAFIILGIITSLVANH